MAVGCAVGTPLAEGGSPSLDPNGMPNAGTGGTGGMVVPNDQDAAVAMFVGEPCERGAMEACACEDSAAMGQRICVANPASPTGGAFSECGGCPQAPADAGTSGAGGAGGAGGASGMSGGAGGTGSAGGMSGGAGGMGGAGGAGGAPACMCMDALACCRDDGSCGVGVPGLCF